MECNNTCFARGAKGWCLIDLQIIKSKGVCPVYCFRLDLNVAVLLEKYLRKLNLVKILT